MSKEASIGNGGLHAGLKGKGAKSSDATTTLKTSPSVDKDATRSGVAPTAKTIGPRSA